MTTKAMFITKSDKFGAPRKGIRYSMNISGLGRHKVVYSHQTLCQSGWSRGFGALDYSPHSEYSETSIKRLALDPIGRSPFLPSLNLHKVELSSAFISHFNRSVIFQAGNVHETAGLFNLKGKQFI